MNSLPLHQITQVLENLAPLSYQESYDNSGLITGNKEMQIRGVILCLDSTEEVLEEAIRKNCNLIIAHHPIIFSGLKKITGKNYVERTIIKAIKNDLAIYAIHTNLDNVIDGVNAMIADKLGLQQTRILLQKAGLLGKLVTFIPNDNAGKLRKALFDAGFGKIGHYDSCSFNVKGTGTFRGNDKSRPFVGEIGKIHSEEETRIEILYEKHKEVELIKVLKENHPYEEVAFDCYPLINEHPGVGSGIIGRLPEPMNEIDFLKLLKNDMQTELVRHTCLTGNKISSVAVAGGAGSFLLPAALAQQADVFITADYKYHQFFDADKRIVIADIGHYESEQFTRVLIYNLLIKNFPTFALHLSEINTNPVKYF